MTYDIIIIGGSSFVGSRFIKFYQNFFLANNLNLLITANTISKLDPLLSQVKNFTITQLNTLNEKAVFDLVQKTKLVINFAGPFDLYAENVVHACAKFGANYLDITGEVYFAKRMSEKYDELAKMNQAKIIPFSGFDSIPSDFSVFLATKLAQSLNLTLTSVDVIFKAVGGFNGGTIKTAMDMPSKITKKQMIDRYYLRQDSPRYQDDYNKIRFIESEKKWVSPFFMEAINSKVVYKSIEKNNSNFIDSDFSYRESLYIPGGKIANFMYTNSSNIFDSLIQKSTGRKFLSKFLPKPGEGPSDKTIEKGYFSATVIANYRDGISFKSTMYSKGDPGNLSTIKLVGASMKAILKNECLDSHGVLTPVMGFGQKLLPFLENEKIKISEFEEI